MDRLQAVADVRQGARHDHAHRVVEVAHPHLVLDADGADVAQVVGHGSGSPNDRSLVESAGHVERWLGHRPAEQAVAEASRGLGGARRRRGARRGGGSRRGGPGCRSASAGSSFGSASRMTQARWPSSARGRAARPASSRNAVVAARSTAAIERSAQASAFWTSGSASPISSPIRPRPCAATSGSRPRRRSTNGHRRDRAADEAALPARRAVDELLELRPAVRLAEDALADRVGEAVDGDPVAGLAGRPAEELPGPLGVVDDEPLEEAEREPARLELGLAEQAVGDEQPAATCARAASPRGSRA